MMRILNEQLVDCVKEKGGTFTAVLETHDLPQQQQQAAF